MDEINVACPFNILHICDYNGPYNDLTPFLDYPGDVVNFSLAVGDRQLSTREAARLFGRPYMGGMDRHGAITSGDRSTILDTVSNLLASAPGHYILAADCTVPSETPWTDIALAVDTAHRVRR
jgi:uroporphyrinogen decarboxylase